MLQERQEFMKIRIELVEELEEDEVVLRCRCLNEEVTKIQNAISDVQAVRQNLLLYKEDTEYYIAIEDILFLETEGAIINAHTRDNVYQTKHRLYELEEILPGYFLRISKSAIINLREVYSISRSNLSTTSVAAFSKSHKTVFVSRHYVKQLKEKLMEVRMR